MARIRTIKPDFWDSERAGKMSILARLTFLGLVSLADDEGRGRADPDWLGGRLHGYDQQARRGLPAALAEIAASGKVQFYEVGACKYYWVKGFAEHQHINHPSQGKFPPPPEDSGVFTASSLNPQLDITDNSGSRAGARSLIPDPPSKNGGDSKEGVPKKPTPSDLLLRWNSRCGEMKPCRDMNSTTKHHAAVRLREIPDLERWESAIKRAASSKFCTGQIEPKNGHKRFFGRFAWLVRPETLSKIEEGVYDDDDRLARKTARTFAEWQAARGPTGTAESAVPAAGREHDDVDRRSGQL